MEFFEVVKKRRSIRNFKPDPLPEGAMEQILDAARWAMSGANGQPWEFVVVTNQETKDKMVDIYTEFSRKRIYTIEQTRDMQYRHNMFRSFYTNPPGWKNAPAIIAVCGDLRTYQATVLATHFFSGEGSPQGTYLKNMGNATQLLCLAAAALGLGTQWVSVNLGWEGKIKALLELPDELIVHTLIPVGYAAYDPAPPYRRELNEIVHYEKFDPSKYRTDEDIIEFLGLLRKKTRPAYDKTVSE
jgi:nitroreductase